MRNLERDIRDLQNEIKQLKGSKKYTVENMYEKRSLDGNAISATANAYVLSTLIKDLKKQGILR